MNAEQKIRLQLTGSPDGEPHFLSQGEKVVYWLTGGTIPDAWVTQHPMGDYMLIRCAGCQAVLGQWPSDHFAKEEIAEQIGLIREAGHEGHKPSDWPWMNILQSCPMRRERV